MVVFTCSHCGEPVQKPKVLKHYQTKCRNRNPSLSCMDCFKDFHGNEYEVHTKCITEAERYSAKGYVPKPGQNKGERKQNAWVEMVQAVLEEQPNVPRSVIRIIEEISKHSNTPRKKPKFLNFVRNVCGYRTYPNDVEAAWDLISVKLNALSNANANNKPAESKKEETTDKSNEDETKKEQVESEETTVPKTKKQLKEEKKRKKYKEELKSAGQVNGNEEIDKDAVSKTGRKRKLKAEQVAEENSNDTTRVTDIQEKNTKKNKKRKLDEENAENETPAQNGTTEEENTEREVKAESNVDKFNWNEVMIKLLKSKDNEMPFKRFQKKILAEYAEVTGKEPSDRIVEKLHKKLKGTNNVRVDKNRVILKVETDYKDHGNCSSLKKEVETKEEDKKSESITPTKQNKEGRWMKLVQQVVEQERKQEHPEKIQNIFQLLPTNKCLPRTKLKFFMFMKKYYKDTDQEEALETVWKIISVKLNIAERKKRVRNTLKKRENKTTEQNKWFSLIGDVLIEQEKKGPKKVFEILRKISSIPTIPRKREAFLKFVKHCNCNADDADIETTWNLLLEKLNNSSSDYKNIHKPKKSIKVPVIAGEENKSRILPSYQTWLREVEKRSTEAKSDPTVDKSVKNILHRLSSYKNVPKKYKRFSNVIKRVVKNSSEESIKAAYEYISINLPQDTVQNNKQSTKFLKVNKENTEIQADKKDKVANKIKKIKNSKNSVELKKIKCEDIDSNDDEIPNLQETKVTPSKATPKRNNKP